VGSAGRPGAAAAAREARAAASRAQQGPSPPHTPKRHAQGCFGSLALREGTPNFRPLENGESLGGGELSKSLLPCALWLPYTPRFDRLEIKLEASGFNLLVPFAGRITP